MTSKRPLALTLRNLRKSKGWTLKQAEEASGVHLSYLSAIENQRRGAGIETLERLARCYASEVEPEKDLIQKLLEIRAKDEEQRRTDLNRRMKPIHFVLKNQGMFGEMILKAISTLRGEEPKKSQFQIVARPQCLDVDWETREIGNSAVIRLMGRLYRVRILVSEELENGPLDPS